MFAGFSSFYTGHILAICRAFFGLALFPLSLLSCSHMTEVESKRLPGPLERVYQDFALSPLYGECDQKFRERILKVAQFFDANEKITPSDALNLPAAKSNSPEAMADKPVIDTGYYPGWEDFFSRYDRVRSRPPSDPIWRGFRRIFMKLMEKDRERLFMSGINALAPSKHDFAVRVSKSLEECLQSPGCVEPHFDPAAKIFVKEVKIYEYLHQRLKGWPDFQGKREILSLWRDRARLDVEVSMPFSPTTAVKRVSKSEFRVFLDPGDFETEKAELKSIIEKFWKSDRYRILVAWVRKSEFPNAFRITKGRALLTVGRVHLKQRNLELSPDFSPRVLNHELGHILGFRDTYRLAFDAQVCKFKDLEDSVGVMGRLGDKPTAVSEADWEALNKAYPI